MTWPRNILRLSPFPEFLSLLTTYKAESEIESGHIWDTCFPATGQLVVGRAEQLLSSWASSEILVLVWPCLSYQQIGGRRKLALGNIADEQVGKYVVD